MKKKVAILLCAVMSVTLFACGSKNDSKGSSNAPSTSTSQSKSTTSNTGSSNNSSNTSSADNSKESSSTAGTDISNMKLTELLGKICENTKVPANDIFELDKDSFEGYSFIKGTDYHRCAFFGAYKSKWN